MDPKYLSVQEELEKLKIISSNHSNSAAKDVKEASTDGPKDEVADGSLFNMFKIECTADQGQFCFKQFTIDGYPSLLLFENGKMKMEFPGPNESNDLKKFILNSINSYQKGLSKKTDNQRTKPSIIPVHDTTKQPKDKPPILTIQDQKKNMYQKALESVRPHIFVSLFSYYRTRTIKFPNLIIIHRILLL